MYYYTWSGPSILATCHIWMGMHYALWCLYYFKMYGSKVKMKFSFSQGWWCDLTAAETLQISFPNKWEFSGCFSLTQYQSLDLVDDFSSHFKIHLWKKADLIKNIYILSYYYYFWLKSQRVIPSIHSVLKDVSNRNRKLINDDVAINIITMHCWEFIGTGTVLPLTASYQSAVPIEKMFDAAECWHLRGHKVGSS